MFSDKKVREISVDGVFGMTKPENGNSNMVNLVTLYLSDEDVLKLKKTLDDLSVNII